MDDDLVAVIIGVLVFVAVCLVVTLTGVLTHESHIREIRYDKTQMIACMDKGNKPLDCRMAVYGPGN